MSFRTLFAILPVFTHVVYSREFRIIEGAPVSIETFPYMAQITLNRKHHCGGSIINRYYILTAAHCTYKMKNETNISPHISSVIVGNDRNMKNGKTYEIEKIIIPPGHSSEEPIQHHDISLLRLRTPIKFSSKIQPVKLSCRTPNPGEMGWVIGFGRTTKMRARGSKRLLGVQLPVINLNNCTEVLGEVGFDAICAGLWNSSKDACVGDSGGPYTINGYQVGVVSWGDGCGKLGVPGVYTNVVTHIKWIEENTNETFCDSTTPVDTTTETIPVETTTIETQTDVADYSEV